MHTVSSSISSRTERDGRKEDLQHSGLSGGLRFDTVVGSIAHTEISLEGKKLWNLCSSMSVGSNVFQQPCWNCRVTETPRMFLEAL